MQVNNKQNSITTTGVDLITTSIIAMESFLSNNVPFNDTDDIITYLSNCQQEKHELHIMDYLDEPIMKDELLDYLIHHVKPNANIDEDIIKSIISKFDAELISRTYYKNQILPLVHHQWFKGKLKKLSQYVYAEEPAPEMVDDLKDFKEKIIDFCHYDYLYEDRYKRAMKDKRKCIVTIDTDSNFINLDKYVKEVSEMLNLDRKDETQQMTVMNIFINITTDVLKKTFWTLTTNMGLIDRCKPIINMKSESTIGSIIKQFIMQTLLTSGTERNQKRSSEKRTLNEYRKDNSKEIFDLGTE